MAYHEMLKQKLNGAVAILILLAACLWGTSSSEETSTSNQHRRITEIPEIPVYSPSSSIAIGRKQVHDLQQSLSTDPVVFRPVSLSTDQQTAFIAKHCGDSAQERYKALEPEQPELATQVYQWCALSKFNSPAAIFWSSSTTPLVHERLATVVEERKSMVILAEPKYFVKSLQSTFVLLQKEHRHIAASMLKTVVETPLDSLLATPLLVPQSFYAVVSKELQTTNLLPGYSGKWTILEQTCHMDPLRRVGDVPASTVHLQHQCPTGSGFCCNIQDVEKKTVIMMSKYPLWPVHMIRHEDLPKPFGLPQHTSHTWNDDDLPYVATIHEEVEPPRKNVGATPNFHEMLHKEECLPSSDECSKCLREKKGANCDTCKMVCIGYCEMLCKEHPKPKFVAKKIFVTPPKHARDSSRLIPRIIHQTWFEDLHPDRYPNMSRLVESFRRSGWEYKFYNDKSAASFLSTHFPPEVGEAYDTLLPGAFKADLFRYCVLLIYGGVYADVDVHLESTLDFSIPPDVGFMVPVDEPGKPVGRQMCLWNGLIAAAPGHPILAKAIETVVNHVRNRFTSVDVDATFCPDPELSILHAYDTLFTAGPCLLGATVNRVYGRHGQQSHVPGELNPWNDRKETEMAISGTSFVLGNAGGSSFVDVTRTSLHHKRIPGRTIILRQDKWDMGAHRFTFLQQNLVVAATDLPDSNDRENIEALSGTTEHYSKAHAKTGIYGLENVYSDRVKKNEDVRFFVLNEHVSQRVEVFA